MLVIVIVKAREADIEAVLDHYGNVDHQIVLVDTPISVFKELKVRLKINCIDVKIGSPSDNNDPDSHKIQVRPDSRPLDVVIKELEGKAVVYIGGVTFPTEVPLKQKFFII
jgi:hypothetical protein